MRLKKINIDWRKYRIEYVDLVNDNDDYAIVVHGRQIIKVCTHRGEKQERASLLHEILHCMEKQIGIELSEALITALATNLYGVFKANPELGPYLSEQVED